MRPPGASLRVATYNVHACIGTDRRHDPDRVASVVGELDADIVALQEFTYAASVAIETREPVELVALDGYQCALGPTRQVATRCFGNALLTRHPIVEVHRLDLSIDGREPRGALAATVDVGGTHVHVLATHLGLRVRERRFQVQQLLSYLESVHTRSSSCSATSTMAAAPVRRARPRSPVGRRAPAALVSLVTPDAVAGPDLDLSGRGPERHVRAPERVGAPRVRPPPDRRRHRSRPWRHPKRASLVGPAPAPPPLPPRAPPRRRSDGADRGRPGPATRCEPHVGSNGSSSTGSRTQSGCRTSTRNVGVSSDRAGRRRVGGSSLEGGTNPLQRHRQMRVAGLRLNRRLKQEKRADCAERQDAGPAQHFRGPCRNASTAAFSTPIRTSYALAGVICS